MSRALWPLLHGRPRIEIALSQSPTAQRLMRDLLADTGAGSQQAAFELILEESDCLRCGGRQAATVQLGGAFSSSYSLYLLRIQIPQLAFDHYLPVVGVPKMTPGFHGIAGFRFLSRFQYGNFGLTAQFGLET